MLISGLSMTVLFFYRFSELRPSFDSIKKERVKNILQLGFSFFILQISAVIIFTTDNIIIAQLFGPGEVTTYEIVKKLFNIIIMGHTIILTPLWSAYTEAYSKCDFVWIKKSLKMTNILMILIIVAVLIWTILSESIINIWVGDSIAIPIGLVIAMAIYTLVHVWNNNYSYLLNGIGRVKISSFISTVGAIINIPISIIFAKYYNLGSIGVILGTICSLLLFSFSGPIETYYVIYKKSYKK